MEPHAHMLVCAHTHHVRDTYPDTHTYTHAQHAHTAGIRGCPSETIPWKLFLYRKKGMKANGDLASNSRVGYPG